MNQRFVRCPHCALPHDVNEVRCPTTGLAIQARKYSARPGAPAGKPAESPLAPSVGRLQAPRVPSFDPPSAPPKQPGSQQKIPVAPRAAVGLHPSKPVVEGSLVGRVLSDKYGVTAIIGEGGMGAVYEAEHLTIGRLVALKVLHPVNAKRADAVQRFHHEARVAGSIGHPNICEIYDVGKLEDGSPYLVMERLHGETLADRIGREGALPFMDVIDIVIQVLSALVAAHAKGVIHRDIKPENTFLSVRAGMPPIAKLLDFGISKVGTDEDLHLTRTGMVMGTPYYMAPEQARGDRTIDQRVDLYAVGVILYESLTGRRPFLAPNYNALLVQILSGTPRPIRDIRPALPQGFDAMVDKALAKSRDNRYQTASDFLSALSALRETLARGPNPAELAKQAARRQPSSRPPPKPAAPSVDIPVHFADPTGSAEYLSVASVELMIDQGTVSDANPIAEARAEERPTMQDVPPLPRPSFDVGDTYVETSPRGSQELHPDLTEVIARALDGNTPVHGSELAMVRRQLRETDPTTVTAPLDPAQAEEIIRAARTRGPRVPMNPMQLPDVPEPPAARPSKLSERPPVPREETAAARAAMANDLAKGKSPEDTSPDRDEDDQPTTFFRPNRPTRAKSESVPPAEMLDDDDEIRDSLLPNQPRHQAHLTDPAPPPSMPAPMPPRPARRK